MLNSWEDNRWPGGAECPGGHREPRGHLRGRGRQAARRAQGDQKDAEFRVARKAPSSLGCADQSGAGVAEWAGLPAHQLVGRARCSACGAVLDAQGRCCVKSSVTGLHSITNQASFVAKREERTLRCSTNRFQDALLCNRSGTLLEAPSKQKYVIMACVASS